VKVNKGQALRLLERAAEVARSGPIDSTWSRLVADLRKVAFPGSITYSIAFGTAALAKATEPKVDTYSVKARLGGNAYSMRGIGNGILAAHALRLGFDLGLRKREPLNNQPFFSIGNVKDIEDRPDNRDVRAKLIEALGVLGETDAAGAFKALAAYLAACPVPLAVVAMDSGAGDDLDQRALVAAIERFVADNSERGARAQAVATGLADVKYGSDRVRVEGVYSPSRNHPLDVAILAEGDEENFELGFEVRDKPVDPTEIGFTAQTAKEHGMKYAGVLAVSSAQRPFDPVALAAQEEVAAGFGVYVRVFTGWSEFVADALWCSHEPATPGDAYRAIHLRLSELEVSPEGMALWKAQSKLA
jgi:SacI restriction endonuclease